MKVHGNNEDDIGAWYGYEKLSLLLSSSHPLISQEQLLDNDYEIK